MRTTIAIVLLGTLALVACTKDKPMDTGSTTTTGATTGPTPEEIRGVIAARRPGGQELINALVITNDNGVITLRGKIEDEPTHSDIVNTVKGMPSVKSVHDELSVVPKAAGATDRATPNTPPAKAAETKTKKTDAIRAQMAKDRPTAALVITRLVITDDGTTIMLSGTVPDDATHDALLKSAQKGAAGEKVDDELKVGAK